MGFISVLNEMRLEEQSQSLIAFGTSRTERVVGFLITISGLLMLCYMYISNCKSELFGYCIFSLIFAFVYCLVGLFLLTTNQYVVIDKINKKVEVEKSCLFWNYKKVIHFNEIAKLEIAKGPKFFSKCCNWHVKAYIKRSNSPFLVECVFFSKSCEESRKVARLISITCDCDIYDGSVNEAQIAYSNKKIGFA